MTKNKRKSNESQQSNSNSGGKRKKKKRKKCGRRPAKSISDEEHASCLSLFRAVDWSEVQNTSRLNVLGKSAKKNSKGKSYCHSFIFGKNMKSTTGELSYFSTAYPELYLSLKRLIKKYHPEHAFTNITINKNLVCKLHQDKGNDGPSFIIGFGKYSKGRLMVQPPGGGEFSYIDCYRTFVPFNGKTQPHQTELFKGERYTAVFYKTSMLERSVASSSTVSNGQKQQRIEPDKNSSLFQSFKKLKQKMARKKL